LHEHVQTSDQGKPQLEKQVGEQGTDDSTLGRGAGIALSPDDLRFSVTLNTRVALEAKSAVTLREHYNQ
jgi:hypothetical protein